MTLVDTSVWIGHWRTPDFLLTHLLSSRAVVVHAFVLGELAARSVAKRKGTLRYFARLPRLASAQESEVHHLLETHRLWGLGLGWIDLHLLAAAMVSGCNVLTSDRAMHAAARKLGIAYPVK